MSAILIQFKNTLKEKNLKSNSNKLAHNHHTDLTPDVNCFVCIWLGRGLANYILTICIKLVNYIQAFLASYRQLYISKIGCQHLSQTFTNGSIKR